MADKLTANKVLLDGVFIPLTVPFGPGGELYSAKLAYNVARASLTPAAGLVALTAENEGDTLSDAETEELLRVVAGAAAAEKVLLAAVPRASVPGALQLAEQAHAAGFDAVLLGAPTDWPRLVAECGERSVQLFLQAVADRSPLPVVLFSEAAPSFTLPVEMIAALARHPNVIGLVDAARTADRFTAIAAATQGVQHTVPVTTVFAAVTGRMLQASVAESAQGLVSIGVGSTAVVSAPAPALKTRTRTVGFQVLGGGSAAGMVELLQAGAAGVMPRLAACAPQGCHEPFAAFKDGDPALALEKQERLRAADAVVERLGVAAVKAACDRNSYFGGAPRLPRTALTADQRAELEDALAAVPN